MTITTDAEKDFVNDLKNVLQKYNVYFDNRNGSPKFYNCKNNEEEIYLEPNDIFGVLKNYELKEKTQ